MWRSLVAGIVCSVVVVCGGPGPADAQAPAPPAPTQAMGTISGTVLDKTSGDPVIEAGVEIIGLGRKTRTDLDGKFSIKVPPGTYELRIFAPLFTGTRVKGVTVKAGEVSKVSTTLAVATAGVEVVEVVAEAKKAKEATQLLKRQRADVVEDNIGAESIQKSPDSDAADVVERMSSVTVEDGKFIYVRGLGERYSSALLNGNRISTPDPEKRVVPLDMFPASFIEALSIKKTYSADLPGDFSGGLVDIDLGDFPDQLQGGLTLSTGGNTATTFQRFRTYRGLGRSLPSIFPNDSIGTPANPQQRAYAASLPDVWNLESITAPPDGGVNAEIGNSWGPFGIALGGSYSNSYQTYSNKVVQTIQNQGDVEDPDPLATESFRYDESTQTQRLSGILTSAYKLTDTQKLFLRGLVNRTTDNEGLLGTGSTSQNAANRVSRLQRTTEQLDFGQLGGEHRWSWLQFDWRSAFSRTTQDIPDSRNLAYVGGSYDDLVYQNDGPGGLRIWSEMAENLTDNLADFTIPFKTRLPYTDVWSGLAANFKFGAAYSYRDRDYDLRLFKYATNGNAGGLLSEPPEELLNPSNIGSDRAITFQEISQPRDRFAATEEIIAGYGLLELPIVRDRLRVIGGVREEYSYINLNTADQSGTPQQVLKNNLNPLPSVNVVYSPLRAMNVRGSWSQTVSRPEFRELTPSLFPQPRGFLPFIGNTEVVQSGITNWDLRWEWFLSPAELVSLGAFYKSIDQPIEPAVLPQGGQSAITVFNANTARVAGIEFEVRKNFGFVDSTLENLSAGLNFTYSESNVKTPIVEQNGVQQQQTSTNRPLVGQAPYVLNAILDYTHPRWGTARLLFNWTDASIQSAGAFGLPDIVQAGRQELDAVFIFPMKETLGLPLSAKLSINNILNDHYLNQQGGLVQERYLKGIGVGLSLSYVY